MKRRNMILGLFMLGLSACATSGPSLSAYRHCWLPKAGYNDMKCVDKVDEDYKLAKIDKAISEDYSYKPFRQAVIDGKIEIGMSKKLVILSIGKPGFTRHLVEKDASIEILEYSKSLGYSKAHIYVKSSVVLTNGLVTSYTF